VPRPDGERLLAAQDQGAQPTGVGDPQFAAAGDGQPSRGVGTVRLHGRRVDRVASAAGPAQQVDKRVPGRRIPPLVATRAHRHGEQRHQQDAQRRQQRLLLSTHAIAPIPPPVIAGRPQRPR
jgi:hypothetical protein